MRFKTLALVALLLAVFSNPGMAKKAKTGYEKDGVFADSSFSYQFQVPFNWKVKTYNEPSLLRATLIKTKLENPPAGAGQSYIEGDRYTPVITVLADTTSLTLDQFLERLMAQKGELPNAKEFMKRLDLLLLSTIEKRIEIEVDSARAVQYNLQKKHLKVVHDPRRRNYGAETDEVVVEEALLGQITALKRGNNIFIIQSVGEKDTFQFEERDYKQLFDNWDFTN
ncbi:MAG: hypothetical protein L0Y74_09465 [candidate division Zixibacteria bacterium]|nr:hypothetical protein [candidate division Zixibacteria bacterium]